MSAALLRRSQESDFVRALDLHKERIRRLQEALCECQHRSLFQAELHDDTCPVYEIAAAMQIEERGSSRKKADTMKQGLELTASNPVRREIPGADPGACPRCGGWRKAGMLHECPPETKRRVRWDLDGGHMDICISSDASPETVAALRALGQAAVNRMRKEQSMSWSYNAQKIEGAKVSEALAEARSAYEGTLQDQTLTGYAEDQAKAAEAAAVSLIESGAIGKAEAHEFNVTLSGHANLDHGPRGGSANDIVSISISQA